MERRWKVLLVTSVAVFMGFLDVTIVNIAFPDIRASFPDSSLAGLSWVLNAYNIVFAALLVPAGRLADMVGRRRMFFIGLITFLAASAVCGLAGSVPVLVGARVVQAAGGAMLVPTSLGLLLPEFPIEQRSTATALWGATGAVAAATGPSLGGVLVHATDWRLVFFVNIPIGLAALIPARRLLREHKQEGGVLPDARRRGAPHARGGGAVARHRQGTGLGLVERRRHGLVAGRRRLPRRAGGALGAASGARRWTSSCSACAPSRWR